MAFVGVPSFGGAPASKTLKYELPQLQGRHAGPRSVVGRFATRAGVSAAAVVTARVNLSGSAIIGQQTCCSTSSDTTCTISRPYALTFFLTGAGIKQTWIAMAEISADGQFTSTARFGAGTPDSAIAHLGASMDSLLVVGCALDAACCSPIGPEPEVTITNAELVLELE